MTTEQNQPQTSQPEGKGGIWLWAGVALIAFAAAGARILSVEPPSTKADAECAEIAAGKREADALQQLACTTTYGFSLHMN